MKNKPKILPNYTYDEYIHWKDRWEIIEGIPYAMSPMPGPKHQRISSLLSVEFELALRKNKCECQVYQPLDLKIKENTVVQPDLLIVCDPIEKNYLDFPPKLVVEIHSPSTILKDKNSKFSLYEEYGIKYYLMVDPEEETVVVYSLNDAGKYKETTELTFEISDGCTISLDASKLFI